MFGFALRCGAGVRRRNPVVRDDFGCRSCQDEKTDSGKACVRAGLFEWFFVLRALAVNPYRISSLLHDIGAVSVLTGAITLSAASLFAYALWVLPPQPSASSARRHRQAVTSDTTSAAVASEVVPVRSEVLASSPDLAAMLARSAQAGLGGVQLVEREHGAGRARLVHIVATTSYENVRSWLGSLLDDFPSATIENLTLEALSTEPGNVRLDVLVGFSNFPESKLGPN